MSLTYYLFVLYDSMSMYFIIIITSHFNEPISYFSLTCQFSALSRKEVPCDHRSNSKPKKLGKLFLHLLTNICSNQVNINFNDNLTDKVNQQWHMGAVSVSTFYILPFFKIIVLFNGSGNILVLLFLIRITGL